MAVRVTFYGVRGSIATPGPSTVRYGGNTVCVSVRTRDDDLIVLDAGTGMRVLGEELVAHGRKLPPSIDVFITHGHWDHIMGLPFFAPVWQPEAHLVLHALSERAEGAIQRAVLFDGEHFPVRIQDVPSKLERPRFTGLEKRAGSARVRAVLLNHPGGCDGFRIDDADGSSICYLTDNELSPPGPMTTSMEDLARFAHGTGLLIHDAQYLPSDMPQKKGWGHSLVDEVLELGRLAEARTVVLHHHDPGRDDRALDEIAVHARLGALARAAHDVSGCARGAHPRRSALTFGRKGGDMNLDAFVAWLSEREVPAEFLPVYREGARKMLEMRIELCDSIDEKFSRERCVAQIAAKTQSASDCERLDAEPRDRCWSEIATKMLDLELCMKAVVANTRSSCVSSIAQTKKDPDVCERLAGQDRDQCLSNLTWASSRDSDGAICQRIASPTVRDNCIAGVARSSNPLLCEKIGVSGSDEHRLACYRTRSALRLADRRRRRVAIDDR
jgi:phosphoribosyl 1,2-cyclic phosphodiesterase